MDWELVRFILFVAGVCSVITAVIVIAACMRSSQLSQHKEVLDG